MGHASVAFTLDRYGQLFPGSEDEAAELLDAYLQRANTQARLARSRAMRERCAAIALQCAAETGG